jgi:hypothetical protein
MRFVIGRPVHFGEALGKGFSFARRSLGVVGLGLLAELAMDLLAIGSGISLAAILISSAKRIFVGLPFGSEAGGPLSALLFTERALVPWAGAWAISVLVVLVLRLLWLASGVRVFGAQQANEAVPGAVGAGVTGIRRALPTALLFVPIQIAIALFNATAIASTGLSFLQALGQHRWGVLVSGALALALILAMLLQTAVDLLLRLALVRAVATGEKPLRALSGAAGLLGARLGVLVGLTAIFAVLYSIPVILSGSGGALLLGTSAAAIALALAARAATGFAGSVLKAFFSTAELGGLCAVEAGARGALPEPTPPAPPAPQETEPIHLSEKILKTERLDKPAPQE